MAVYLVYRKVSETPETVEYRWGDDPGALSRRVVLDPRAPTRWPTVGGEEPLMPTLVRAVVKRQRETGTWPDRGVVEH